jgi:hypothetical protein
VKTSSPPTRSSGSAGRRTAAVSTGSPHMSHTRSSTPPATPGRVPGREGRGGGGVLEAAADVGDGGEREDRGVQRRGVDVADRAHPELLRQAPAPAPGGPADVDRAGPAGVGRGQQAEGRQLAQLPGGTRDL